MSVLLLALLGLLSALVQASAQRILNLKANDPMLHFREGWQIATVSNTVQSFLLTNKTGLALKVDLPASTRALKYSGLQRTGGSVYGVCFDICDDTSTFLLADGHNDTLADNADASPIVIFNGSIDPSSRHTLFVFNMEDTRHASPSQITFVSLSIELDDAGTSSSEGISSSPTPSSSSATSSVIIASSSPVTSGETSGMPSSTPSSTDTPAGGGAQSVLRTSTIIVIASLGSVAVISPIAGLGLLMWIRRRRQRWYATVAAV